MKIAIEALPIRKLVASALAVVISISWTSSVSGREVLIRKYGVPSQKPWEEILKAADYRRVVDSGDGKEREVLDVDALVSDIESNEIWNDIEEPIVIYYDNKGRLVTCVIGTALCVVVIALSLGAASILGLGLGAGGAVIFPALGLNVLVERDSIVILDARAAEFGRRLSVRRINFDESNAVAEALLAALHE